MKTRHPRAHPDVPGKPPGKVDRGDETVAVDDDGLFTANGSFAEALADRYGVPRAVTDPDVPLDEVDLGGEAEGQTESESEPDGEADTAEDAESGASADATTDEGDTSSADGADDTADEGGTCEAIKNDGEVCGRDLPCQYHPDEG